LRTSFHSGWFGTLSSVDPDYLIRRLREKVSMTPKAYLNQAYRLEQRIRLDQEELNNLRDLASDVGSPGFEEHYNPNHRRCTIRKDVG
jgi:methylphosphotriester-DNA--protein-cysteine methyltransferase